jgi:hypothetical protein
MEIVSIAGWVLEAKFATAVSDLERVFFLHFIESLQQWVKKDHLSDSRLGGSLSKTSSRIER